MPRSVIARKWAQIDKGDNRGPLSCALRVIVYIVLVIWFYFFFVIILLAKTVQLERTGGNFCQTTIKLLLV